MWIDLIFTLYLISYLCYCEFGIINFFLATFVCFQRSHKSFRHTPNTSSWTITTYGTRCLKDSTCFIVKKVHTNLHWGSRTFFIQHSWHQVGHAWYMHSSLRGSMSKILMSTLGAHYASLFLVVQFFCSIFLFLTLLLHIYIYTTNIQDIQSMPICKSI